MEKMKKIKKKDFIALLSSKESAILYCMHFKKEMLAEIEEAISEESASDESNRELEFRTVGKNRSNGLQFSNGSIIDFNKDDNTFYRCNNCAVYSYTAYCGNDNDIPMYYYIVYLLK